MTSSTRFTSATTATAFGGEALAVRTPAPAMTASITPIAREIRTRLLRIAATETHTGSVWRVWSTMVL